MRSGGDSDESLVGLLACVTTCMAKAFTQVRDTEVEQHRGACPVRE